MQAFNMFCSRVNSNLLIFFSAHEVSLIKSKEILDFVEFLGNKSIKAVTIKQYLGLLKRILSIAVLEGFLDGLPVFPKVKSKSIPRASLSIGEYLRVLRSAKTMSNIELSSDRITHRNTANNLYVKDDPIPHEIQSLIGFMTNTFLRPVDIKLIKHKHVQVIENKTSYLKINLPETKSHVGQIISLRAAVRIYKRLTALSIESGYGNSEDYVFLPHISNRETAIQAISHLFGRILRAENLEVNGDGQKRSLYSLRHTAITFRLIYGQGIDLLTLARNARTSVEMIEKFYASNLQAEMNVDILQSKRTKQRFAS
jgi:integrase